MPERTACTDAGMTRLCILADDIVGIAKDLESKHGIEPIAPMGVDGSSKGICFQDPDGFIMYFVEYGGIVGAMMGLQLWWAGRPKRLLFHWTINVTDHTTANPIFEKVGLSNVNRSQERPGNEWNATSV